METKIIRIENSTKSIIKNAFVQFVPNRGKIFDITADGIKVFRISNYGFNINFKNELKQDSGIDLKVEYEGEVATLDKISFTKRSINSETIEYNLENQLPVFFNADNIWGNFLLRGELIEKVEDPIKQKAHRFFYKYDYETNSNLYPIILSSKERIIRDGMIDDNKVHRYLLSNVIKRVKIYRDEGRIPRKDELKTRDIKFEIINYLSALQKPIFEKYYIESGDVEGLTDAFFSFSNGELRLSGHGTNAEPDSAHEFFFAEWALAAIENGIDPDFWKKLFPIFVMSQEIYMKAYEPTDVVPPNYHFEHYEIDNFSISKQVNPSFKINLKKRYYKKTHDWVLLQFSENCYKAFPAGL